ncbi:MAG: hypothetical protein R2813_01215 [Flavobacteriales bacterium]
MKVAVTDANIFIDLIDLDLLNAFFSLDLDVHTSFEVYGELYPEQQSLLNGYRQNKRLNVVAFQAMERTEIMQQVLPARVSIQDRTVLYLANKLNAMLLSSDKDVRIAAKNRHIEYHGMLWVFDQLVDKALLNASDAIIKLNRLCQINTTFQNNEELIREIKTRLTGWST